MSVCTAMAGPADPNGDRILNELYGLTEEETRVWNWLSALVDEALDQLEKGYAVSVEAEMVCIAKAVKIRPRR